MPFGFTHMFFSWAVAKVMQYFKKINFSMIEWFALLFGSIFPDVDYLLQWVSGNGVHRLLTHSLLMIVFSFLLSYAIFYYIKKILKKDWNIKKIALLFSLGIASHIVLDMFTGKPGVPLLWPLDKWFYFFGVLQEPFRSVAFDERNIEILVSNVKWGIFDIGLGTAWLFYFMIRNKLKDM